MKAIFKATNPDDIEATITFTAPISEWKRLREQMHSFKWPSSEFSNKIDNLIYRAEMTFSAPDMGMENDETKD